MYLTQIKKILLAILLVTIGAAVAYLFAFKQHVSSMKEVGLKDVGAVFLQSIDVVRKYKQLSETDFENYIFCRAFYNLNEIKGYREIIERDSMSDSKKNELFYELDVLENEYAVLMKNYGYKSCGDQ